MPPRLCHHAIKDTDNLQEAMIPSPAGEGQG